MNTGLIWRLASYTASIIGVVASTIAIVGYIQDETQPSVKGGVSSFIAYITPTLIHIHEVLNSQIEFSMIYVLVVSISIVALVIYIFLMKKALSHSIPFKSFTESLVSFPIDDSLCGTYFSMRSMAGTEEGDKNRYYYTQRLTISKSSNGEFTFEFIGYWNNKDYPIRGSCVRVNTNLVLYGSSFGKLPSFQVAMLGYPDGEEDLKGVFSLTRMKKSASMSTKIIITKLDPNTQNTGYSRKAYACFDASEVLEANEAISILDSKKQFLCMKQYLDADWDVEGLLES